MEAHTIGINEPREVLLVKYPRIVAFEMTLLPSLSLRPVLIFFRPWYPLYCGWVLGREEEIVLPR